MRSIVVRNLGKMNYASALKIQEDLWASRHSSNFKDTLLLVEHVPQVYTLGRRDKVSDILINEEQLKQKGIEVHHISRGGNVTWHGPGQLVGYPILDLNHFKKDVRWYFSSVQKVIQLTLEKYNIASGIHCDPTFAGVWVGPNKTDKIAAMGVQLSRWFTMHGFALNVNPNLSAFSSIIPCGITDPKYTVTSMAKELKKEVTVEEVTPLIIENFGKVFGATMIQEG